MKITIEADDGRIEVSSPSYNPHTIVLHVETDSDAGSVILQRDELRALMSALGDMMIATL